MSYRCPCGIELSDETLDVGIEAGGYTCECGKWLSDTDLVAAKLSMFSRLARIRERRELPVSGLSEEAVSRSRAAAEAIKPFVGSWREIVFKAIEGSGDKGLTDVEIQRLTNIKPNTERPRRQELWQGGRIKIKRDGEGRPVYRKHGVRNISLVWVVGKDEPCPTCGALYTKTTLDSTLVGTIELEEMVGE